MSQNQKYAGEQVLAIRSGHLQQMLPRVFREPSCFTPMNEEVLSLLWDASAFVDRGPAEEDPSLKQLIPYLVVKQGEQVLCYRRGNKGEETRLHDKWSIGVGGHINPVDVASEVGGHAFTEALRRELLEELKLSDGFMDSIRFIGVVNDDADLKVGAYHLGLVYVVEVVDGVIFEFENCLKDARWTLLEYYRDEQPFGLLEGWSQLVAKALPDLLEELAAEQAGKAEEPQAVG